MHNQSDKLVRLNWFSLSALVLLLLTQQLHASACSSSDVLFPLENPGSWSATASASTGSWVPANLIDNDVSTIWLSGPELYSDITVDMGANHLIAGLQYFMDANANVRFADYEVSYSTNGTDFTSMTSGTLQIGLPDGEFHAQFIEFPTQVTARYFRLKSTSGRAYVGGQELMPLVCSSTGEFVPAFKPGTCSFANLSSGSQTASSNYAQYRYGHNWHVAKIATGTSDADTMQVAKTVSAWQHAIVVGDPSGSWLNAADLISPAVLAAEWIGSSRYAGHGGNVDYLYRLDFDFLGDAMANSAYNQILAALQPTITLNLYSDNAVYNVLLNGEQLIPSSGSYSSVYNNDGFTTEAKDVEFMLDWSKVIGGNNTLLVHLRSGQYFSGLLAAVNTSGACAPTTFDFGDAPESYGTSAEQSGAAHAVSANLYLGSGVAADDDGSPGGNDSSDNGVSFRAGADGGITAIVTGTNDTGSTAMLCGYLDGAADAMVDGSFARSLLYLNQVGTGGGHEVATGNEELCVQVPGSASSSSITLSPMVGFNGADANCTTAVDKQFSCDLNFYPDFGGAVITYARFRLTTDSEFFSNASPSPTGLAADGEVEDYSVNYDATAAVIESVRIERMPLQQLFASHDAKSVQALLPVLDAGQLTTGGSDTALPLAVIEQLDPDGDGAVAMVHWSTLDELGTVGFFVERSVAESGLWQRLNQALLPGLMDAPLGGQYRYIDTSALAGVDYLYRLIEQEAWGRQRTHGPYR